MISKKAACIKAYVAGEQPQTSGWVKLNTNENPYPSAEWKDTIDRASLRLYPDPDCTALKDKIARLHGVDPSQVFVGNGSDEVLAVAFQALFDSDGAPVLAPDITYSFYPVYASLYDIPYRTVAVKEDFSIDVSDYGACGGIVLANPNAPTSLALGREEMLRLADAHKTVNVIADEAYIDFCAESVMDGVKTRGNLLVVRTLSKSYSLAGLRVGYAVGSSEQIGAMERIKNCFNSYTVDRIAQSIARNAIGRQDVMTSNAARIVATRTRLAAALRGLGFDLPEPSANFVFARHARADGKAIFDALKERKILVRRWDAPRIGQYLRISVGTERETDVLLAALEEILQKLA